MRITNNVKRKALVLMKIRERGESKEMARRGEQAGAPPGQQQLTLAGVGLAPWAVLGCPQAPPSQGPAGPHAPTHPGEGGAGWEE